MKLHRLLPCLLVVVLASDVYACGESLYRVGKGINYREYTAPLPGNLLVYGAAGDADDLARELELAGHKVSVAKNPSELAYLADRGEYQVVIGPYSEYDNFQALSVLSNAQYIPVVIGGVDEREAKQQFDEVMVPSKHEIRHYLKAIHKTLKKA